MKLLKTENVLSDDYPIFASGIYIFDLVVTRSPMYGYVRDVKKQLGVEEVRRLAVEAIERKGVKIGDRLELGK